MWQVMHILEITELLFYHLIEVTEGSPKIINEPDKRFDVKYDKNVYHDLDYIRFALYAGHHILLEFIRNCVYELKIQYRLERSIMIILRIKIWKRGLIATCRMLLLIRAFLVWMESQLFSKYYILFWYLIIVFLTKRVFYLFMKWREYKPCKCWQEKCTRKWRIWNWGSREIWIENHESKFLKESSIKTPKVLKDMLLKLWIK